MDLYQQRAISRRAFLGTAAGVAGVSALGGPKEGGAAGGKPPNIVIVFTDDAGYSDVGCFGSEIPTPNVDALAAEGLRFRKFYTCARCSPSRASLLTGQYPHSVGAGDLCRPSDETSYPGYLGYMNRENVTIAEVLRSAGYRTVMSGKWHLGGERVEGGEPAPGEKEKWPTARGFEKFFGLIHGQTGYFRPWDVRPFRLGEKRYEAGDTFYATDAITDYAIRFLREIRQEGDAPFFLYLPYTAPHAPHEAPKALVEKYRQQYGNGWGGLHGMRVRHLAESGLIPSAWEPQPLPQGLTGEAPGEKKIEMMATHAAMLEIWDRNVGRVVQELERLGERDNTVIFVLSDNGAAGPHHPLCVTPFTGSKGNLHEGGTATHCVVNWPAGISDPGRVLRQAPHLIDMLPTCLEIAGADYPDRFEGRQIPPPAGVSFLSLLQGESWRGHDRLFWDLYGQQAVIEGRWKYYNDLRNRPHLYDLQEDGTEMHDLAEQYPDKVRALAGAHAEWARRHHVLPFETVLEAQGRLNKLKRIRRIREQ